MSDDSFEHFLNVVARREGNIRPPSNLYAAQAALRFHLTEYAGYRPRPSVEAEPTGDPLLAALQRNAVEASRNVATPTPPKIKPRPTRPELTPRQAIGDRVTQRLRDQRLLEEAARNTAALPAKGGDGDAGNGK